MKKAIYLIIHVGIIGALLFTFFVMNTANKYSINFNNSHTLEISNWNNETSKNELYNTIKHVSEKNGSSVYKVLTSNNGKNRTVFLIGGDKYHFSSFNPTYRVTNKNISNLESTADIRGTYIVVGNSSWIQKFIKDNSINGLTTDNSFLYEYQNIISNSNISTVVYVYLLVLLGCITFYILYSYRETAIKLTNGFSIFKISNNHTTSLLITTVFSALTYNIISLILLFFYNKWSQVGIYILFSNALITILVVIIVAFFYLASLLFYFINITDAIKGKFNVTIIVTTTIIFKIIITLIVLMSTSKSMSNYEQVNYLESLRNQWQKVDKYVTVDLSRTFPTEGIEGKKSFREIRKLFNQTKYPIIFSQNNVGYEFDDNNYDPYVGNIIVVNHKYMQMNKLYSTSGKIIKSDLTNNNIVNVYIPQKEVSNKNKIERSYRSWFKFVTSDVNNPVLRFITVKNNQKSFTYNSVGKEELNNPIILEINTNAINNEYLLTALSQGQVLFNKNIAKLKESSDLVSMGLVSSYTNVNEYAIQKKNIAITELVTNIIVIIISIVFSYIFLFLILKIIIKYFERIIWIKKINGWSPYRTFQNVYIATFALDLIVWGLTSSLNLNTHFQNLIYVNFMFVIFDMLYVIFISRFLIDHIK